MYLRYVYMKFKYTCNSCLQKCDLGLSVICTNFPFTCAVSTKTCIDICREQRTFDTHSSSHKERVGM